MELSDTIALVLSTLSIIVSVVVAYLTLLARFRGRIWPVTTFVFTKFSDKERDHIPAIGVACFVENQGARPGRLDNLRLRLSNSRTESQHAFYPHLVRKDYSIYASYQDSAWFPFGGIGLFEKGKAQEYYLLFRPNSPDFVPAPGEHEFVLEALWMGRRRWTPIKPRIALTLTEKHVADWRSPTTPAFQIKVAGR